MTGVLAPNWVAEQITRSQYEEKRSEFRRVEVALQEIDPRLSLVYVGARVPLDKCPVGALPGRFHVRRDNSEKNVPDSYMPIVNQHGEYTDPDMGIVDNLKKHDLWNSNVTAELEKRWAAEEKAAIQAREDVKEELRIEFAERYKSKVNPGILFSDIPWTYKPKKRGS